ncbi:MAG: hypothetical protein NTZ55_03805 [Candidatus Roizmanbacteria bacterium]|nr:hypothetical protein [Candidatus Roizmanbacteria bacterium]
MKKETSIAVGMGIVFGLVFSFLVIANTQKNQSVSQKTPVQKTRPVTTEQQTIMQPITITEPNDGAIIANQSVTIKGKTDKNSFIIVQTQVKDFSFTTKTDTFEYSVPLTLGENVIHITAYPKGSNGKVQEKELHVYYLNTK